MHNLESDYSKNLLTARTIALNYFKATLEQMPTQIQTHPVLLTAIETMEHYITGEATDAERHHMVTQTSELHFSTRTPDPAFGGFDVANNPLSGLADTASCMLADNLDDISYTSYACDLALIMQRTGAGLVEAKERLEERLKRFDGKL